MIRLDERCSIFLSQHYIIPNFFVFHCGEMSWLKYIYYRRQCDTKCRWDKNVWATSYILRAEMIQVIFESNRSRSVIRLRFHNNSIFVITIDINLLNLFHSIDCLNLISFEPNTNKVIFFLPLVETNLIFVLRWSNKRILLAEKFFLP